MDTGLPISVQKLLWDADPRSLASTEHQQLIIERVLNYGMLADWRWLVARYGAHSIHAALKTRGAPFRTAIRSQARELASLIIR